MSGRELTSTYANLPETVRSAVRITKHEEPDDIAIDRSEKHHGINSPHAIRRMTNIVVGGVITLNDIICKTCHSSWPG